ncbi:MAG: transposase [Nautiliaceae bacterium]
MASYKVSFTCLAFLGIFFTSSFFLFYLLHNFFPYPRKYPHVVRSWRINWEELTTYFKYPYEMRKIMYTTNIIESINRAFRRVTDKKRVFPSDEALIKNLYLAIERLEKKWEKSKIKNWAIIYRQLSEIFKERLEV